MRSLTVIELLYYGFFGAGNNVNWVWLKSNDLWFDTHPMVFQYIVKEWQRKKPAYDKKIQENEQKIEKLNEDIENLIMERLNDLGRKELYDKMINKKQKEVKELNRKNKELKQYNLVCKKRQEELDNFAEFLKEVLAQDTISDISMRMVVNKIVVHQNEDKTLDIKFEMNGKLGDNKEIEIPE